MFSAQASLWVDSLCQRISEPKQWKQICTKGFGLALETCNPKLSEMYQWFEMSVGTSLAKKKKKNAEWEDTEKFRDLEKLWLRTYFGGYFHLSIFLVQIGWTLTHYQNSYRDFRDRILNLYTTFKNISWRKCDFSSWLIFCEWPWTRDKGLNIQTITGMYKKLCCQSPHRTSR